MPSQEENINSYRSYRAIILNIWDFSIEEMIFSVLGQVGNNENPILSSPPPTTHTRYYYNRGGKSCIG